MGTERAGTEGLFSMKLRICIDYVQISLESFKTLSAFCMTELQVSL